MAMKHVSQSVKTLSPFKKNQMATIDHLKMIDVF